MNLHGLIQELSAEREKLDKLIALLEELQQLRPGPADRFSRKRRGRKFMSEQERLQVSERMQQNWAKRRLERRGNTAQVPVTRA